MSSTGTPRIVWGAILATAFGLFALQVAYVEFFLGGLSAYGVLGLVGLLIGVLLTRWSIDMLVRGIKQRRVYLSGTHSTDQRSADLS